MPALLSMAIQNWPSNISSSNEPIGRNSFFSPINNQSRLMQSTMSTWSEPIGKPQLALHLSYVSYFATGEGVTMCLAIAKDAATASRILKERIPDYFFAGIVTVPICSSAGEEAKGILNSVSEAVLSNLMSASLGCGYYFSELHYNKT